MQTRFCTLEHGQEACDVLAKCVVDRKHKAGDDFRHCKLNPNKFQVGNIYDSDDDFISGVIKLQREQDSELTRDEEIACKGFLAPRKTAAVAEPAKKRMKYSELLKAQGVS